MIEISSNLKQIKRVHEYFNIDFTKEKKEQTKKKETN